MSAIPHQALSFGLKAGKLALSHGLKAGIAKAAAKLNPVTIVLEAAFSVLDAVDSWMKLKASCAHRDGLRALLPKHEEAMRLEREKLATELTLAQKELQQEMAIRDRIGRINLICARLCGESIKEMLAIRRQQLPDVDRFERSQDELSIAWSKMREALNYYNQTNE